MAVSSSDQRVDCVGACVGVRGSRIKNIVDELDKERIDIVRWNDDPEVLIPNALQPAEVDQVLLCDMIGRAIVLVREDQLSLAIGKRGQNVRLASKLCGWDIEIMTADELDEQIERAVLGFSELNEVNEELAQTLVEQGYLSYDDLSVIEPDALMELGGLTEEQVNIIVEQADAKAQEAELAAAEERRRQREADRLAAEQAAQAAAQAAAAAEEAPEETDPETATTTATDDAPEPTDGGGDAESGESAADEDAAEQIAEISAAENDESAVEETASEDNAGEDAGADDETSGDTDTTEDPA